MIRLFRFSAFAFFISISLHLSGQDEIIYTHKFTSLIEDYELNFHKPDGWFKIFPWEDEFLQYNLVLHSVETGMDMRFVIYPGQHKNNQYPDYELAKMIAHVASSDDQHLVFVKSVEQQELSQAYYAEWGSIVSFTPKPQFSDKERGKILALQHSEKGSIYIIFLFDGSSEQVTPYLNTLTFLTEEKNKSG